MKQFFKFFFASMLGFIIGSVLLFFILIGIIAGFAASFNNEKATTIHSNSILEIKLTTLIPERTSKNPLDGFDFNSFESNKAIGLNDIIKNIKKAESDANIKGIYLRLGFSPNSYATLEEIRNALIEFKKSKKFIVSYGDFIDEHSYYVASVSDKVILNPSGNIEMNGFTQQVVYLKNMFDKIGLKPELIRHGKYKAAAESFITDHMSDENRQQIQSYVGSMFNHFVNNISISRKIPTDKLMNIIDNFLVQNSKDAKTFGLIDDALYQDQVDEILRKMSGIASDNDLEIVSNSKYRTVNTGSVSTSDNKIAIIYCVGEIGMGQGDDNSMGCERIAETISKVRKDKSYKAIVLRVNSPGGSALASDIIWREVVLAKNDKPVIVSMGDVAASGGYYIAAPADVIVAQPNTITGSIGVFGLLFNAQELLNNKMGVKIETVNFGRFADLGKPDRALSDGEKAIIQKEVDHIYNDFVNRVAEGRKMTNEQVDMIAQGRVWSGIDAKKIGLVDEFGGLDRAVKIASEKAKLGEYRTVDFPTQKDPFENILKEMGAETEMYFTKKHLGENYIYFNQLEKAMKNNGFQTRMTYDVSIK
ncbi:MAG: signal peptide peptidase SppA [Bacteroidetes bacterium]|nr:signal peptide peptidase SppA [Bacteroidota bacterium]